jgi:3'-phosphoadenosine 5'-phosphosulfate sulfotransferase (PAPS reductase)/FAD synthetase
VTLDLLWREYPEYITGVLHVDTGIAISTTEPFCRAFADDRGLEYHVQRTPVVFEDYVRQYGFPGPSMHGQTYNLLKERAIDAFVAAQKRAWNDRIGLITGVRAEESARRAKTSRDVRRDGAQLWIAPLIDYTGHDLRRHREKFGVPMSPASEAIHISGDCVCGAMVDDPTQTELSLIRAFDPVGDRIRDLEREISAKGHPRCKWGVKIEGDGEASEVGDLCVSCARSPQLELGGVV